MFGEAPPMNLSVLAGLIGLQASFETGTLMTDLKQ
jgi:hypothetical protein